MPTILLASPHYNGSVIYGSAQGGMLLPHISRRNDVQIIPRNCGTSLLAKTFNYLWCLGLEFASVHEVDYFAMLHADIVPQPQWLDVLLGEMERLDADVISAVVPIKKQETTWGDCPTSTAVGTRWETWEPTRVLTNADCQRLPETFCVVDTQWPDQKLLLNTGCWLANLRRPFWYDTDGAGDLKHYFTVRDKVRLKGRDTTGRAHLEISCESEDWAFSRRLPDDAKVYATRKCKVEHIGPFKWRNYPPEGWAPTPIEEPQEATC